MASGSAEWGSNPAPQQEPQSLTRGTGTSQIASHRSEAESIRVTEMGWHTPLLYLPRLYIYKEKSLLSCRGFTYDVGTSRQDAFAAILHDEPHGEEINATPDGEAQQAAAPCRRCTEGDGEQHALPQHGPLGSTR